MQSQQKWNTQIKSESWILINIMYFVIDCKCFMFELLVIETSPICQSLLSQVLFGRRRKEFKWHLYWKPELAISLLKSSFYNPLSTYFCRERPLSWRNPFLSFRKWFVRAQFSAFFKVRFWGGGWDQPDCF